MSKEDSSPSPSSSSRGLLSKVVRFVRHPTVNWSEIDSFDEERESQYSKQMLKEMIERKRRNDFVRRREFDQLRKLRTREGARAQPPEDPTARTSFFQTSVSSPDERADTLRKIDEIEAQMSQQWWKGKAGTAPAAPAVPAAAAQAGSEPAVHADQTRQPSPAAAAMAAALAESPFAAGDHARAFAPTAPLGLDDSPAAPLAPLVAPAPPPAVSASEPQSAPVPEKFVHDPDLEEPAIRFASADYPGAESALRDVLAQREADADSSDAAQAVWLTLFDLFRATGQQDQFDLLAIDYAARFHRSAPLWFSIPQQLGLPVLTGASQPAGMAPRELSWNAPAMLTQQSVAALQASLARAAQPWTLSWTRLTDIEPAVVPTLAELIERLADEPVQLRFVGAPALQALLQARTPSGERSRDPQWWRLRMAFLRLMGLADEFELAALDYCVTYEVSPPSWAVPRCSFTSDADAPAQAPAAGQGRAEAQDSDLSSFLSSGFALSQPPGSEEGPMPSLVGHIEGDAGAALQSLQELLRPGMPLVVACDQLIRIDFAAVGGVLNWAAAQQAAGHVIEFRNLHRLVAVLFNVIGVNEHARIVPRRD